MKLYILLLMTISLTARGQYVNDISQNILVEAFDVHGTSMTALKKLNIEGTPFVNDNWQRGKVIFTNGKIANNQLIRFDLNKQVLQFRRDSVIYTFSDPVKEFILPATDSSVAQILVFRSGYPANGQLSTNFFYNVLFAGKKFELVKSVLCRLQDRYQYIGASSQQYQTTEELYLFDVQAQKFTKIKKGRQKNLVQYNNDNTAAKEYFEKHPMESENDLVGWVLLLNK
jgi:hypothetical protein